jgi:hypothetical protein
MVDCLRVRIVSIVAAVIPARVLVFVPAPVSAEGAGYRLCDCRVSTSEALPEEPKYSARVLSIPATDEAKTAPGGIEQRPHLVRLIG